ncbi:MAG: hypothetical protein ACYTFY_19225 [Planctomycetota bacterium]|jgi:hypothetical protein
MKTITINIKNDSLADKVSWFLEHLKDDGLEIVSKEEIKTADESPSEEVNWSKMSLSQAVKGMESEPELYSTDDVKESI